MTKLFLGLVNWIKAHILHVNLRGRRRKRSTNFEPHALEPLERRN